MFDKFFKSQDKYFHNFMRVFELFPLFTQTIREQLWELHLSTLYELAKYFIAYDIFTYARKAPVYLFQIYELKQKDCETGHLFNSGYFKVSKTSVPCTVIGVDHAVEYENQSKKVLGGIKCIANDVNKLDKSLIILPEISQIIMDFCEAFDIEDYNTKTNITSRLAIKTPNVGKLANDFIAQYVNFDKLQMSF